MFYYINSTRYQSSFYENFVELDEFRIDQRESL